MNDASAPPMADAGLPVLVEVTRGPMTESRHRGSAIVVDAEARVVGAWGDAESPVYPRSAIKPVQALAFVESGAVEAFGLGDEEIALACASHSGEQRHAAAVTAWLERIGLGIGDLECGPQMPSHENSARALLTAGAAPTPAHNNCSGKHAGMLSTAVQLGDSTAGYVKYGHPVQQRILGLFEQICGVDLGDAPWGVDGCSIPTIAVPLGNLALAMARFVDPDRHLPEHRAAAARRVAAAMLAEPFMVAGTGRFCTAALQLAGGKALVKTGAEGVYMAGLPEHGLGIALKIDDGATRGAEAAMAALLHHYGAIDEAGWTQLAGQAQPVLLNRAGIEVGAIRASAGWPA